MNVQLIEDSISPKGIRLSTLQLTYPRMIHSEFMTHRVFCLDGESVLEFDLPTGAKNKDHKRIFNMTLSEFVDKWQNGDSLGRSMHHRLSNMKIRQLNEETQKIETSTVKDCVISGEKEVFEIEAGGMKVAGSKDHRILTVAGWKPISQLNINKDFIITRASGKLDEDVVDPIRLKKFEANWKSTWLNQIRKNKLSSQEHNCFDCGTELTKAPHDLHHVIPVYEDESKAFDYDNIIAVCKTCHKNRHAVQGWQGDTYLYGRPEKLISIKSLGIKKTYDLEINGKFPNFIANGIVVHNSRNASSSRAIPTKKLLDAARNVEGMPVYWGSNQPGMQAGAELTGTHLRDVKEIWIDAANNAADLAEMLMQFGLHKQLANRILEPFLNITVVVTSTDWDNFFALRSHPDAQPEIHHVSNLIQDALVNNEPKLLNYGQYHLPYVSQKERDTLDNDILIRCSAARCARTSYLNHDKSDPIISDDIDLYNMLVLRPYKNDKGEWGENDPIHCYDSQTEVMTNNGFKLFKNLEATDLIADIDKHTGEFKGWVFPDAIINTVHSGKVFTYENKDISLRVTDGHTLIGMPISVSSDRAKPLQLKPYRADTLTSNKSTKTYMAEVEAKMLAAANNSNIISSILGKLAGFYIGDGYKIDNTIAFHLKKKRKIDYLLNILKGLNLQYSINKNNKSGTSHIRVYKCDITSSILRTHLHGSRNKQIGEQVDIAHIQGIFDGLKNSDGSIKRKTWSYATSSKQLKSDFLRYGPLIGLWVKQNKTYKDCYKLMVLTKPYILVNYSRKSDSAVTIEHVSNEKFYCVTVPHGALLTRRNNLTVISGNCSPVEHQAKPLSLSSDQYTHEYKNGTRYSGNFRGWTQYRQLL